MLEVIAWSFVMLFMAGFALLIAARRKTIADILRSVHDEHDFEIYEDTDKASRAAAPADHRFTRAK